MFITEPLNPSVAADCWSYVCLYLFIYLLFFSYWSLQNDNGPVNGLQ